MWERKNEFRTGDYLDLICSYKAVKELYVSSTLYYLLLLAMYVYHPAFITWNDMALVQNHPTFERNCFWEEGFCTRAEKVKLKCCFFGSREESKVACFFVFSHIGMMGYFRVG